MPEEQNIQGDKWNKQFNTFLKTVMRWQQKGESNTDITDPATGKPRGIDSVFAYKRNPNGPQQIILVEAKTSDKLQNINKNKIQDWITSFHSKLESLPLTREFKDKYRPETDAQYQLGLIGLWVRDSSSYSHSKLQSWFSQIILPKRMTAHYIIFISNHEIMKLSAVYEELERLKNLKDYQSIDNYFPDYGEVPLADGNCLPIEVILSKFIFCKATKLEFPKANREPVPYQAVITFYFGKIQDYHDLRFIGLALKRFQFFQANELVIYTLRRFGNYVEHRITAPKA